MTLELEQPDYPRDPAHIDSAKRSIVDVVRDYTASEWFHASQLLDELAKLGHRQAEAHWALHDLIVAGGFEVRPVRRVPRRLSAIRHAKKHGIVESPEANVTQPEQHPALLAMVSLRPRYQRIRELVVTADSEAASNPDGPGDFAHFWFRGEERTLDITRKPWELLEFLYERREENVRIADIAIAVWNRRDMEWASMKSTLCRMNRALTDSRIALTWEKHSDFVRLRR